MINWSRVVLLRLLNWLIALNYNYLQTASMVRGKNAYSKVRNMEANRPIRDDKFLGGKKSELYCRPF